MDAEAAMDNYELNFFAGENRADRLFPENDPRFREENQVFQREHSWEPPVIEQRAVTGVDTVVLRKRKGIHLRALGKKLTKRKSIAEYVLGDQECCFNERRSTELFVSWLKKAAKILAHYLSARICQNKIRVVCHPDDNNSVFLVKDPLCPLVQVEFRDIEYNRASILEDLLPLVKESIILLAQHYTGTPEAQLRAQMDKIWP